jgi:DNA-binding transcriptional MerR regulator
MEKALPAIPAKRYFTIGEVSELCGVKPYVLRYWEQEFTQLKPMKRRGNRRYYQHHEVLLIRRIRELLYEQGFTISGARNRLAELQGIARHEAHTHPGQAGQDHAAEEPPSAFGSDAFDGMDNPAPVNGHEHAAPALAPNGVAAPVSEPVETPLPLPEVHELSLSHIRAELLSIRDLLTV